MDGIFGGRGLPPGLQGFVAAQEMAQRRQQQGLQSGLGVLQAQQMMRQGALEEQMQPLKLAQLQAAVKDAEQQRAIRQGVLGQIMGGMPGGAVSPQGAMSAGAAHGDVGPTATNAARIGAPAGGVMGGFPGVNPMAALMMLSGDAGIGKVGTAIQDANKPIAAREGAPVINPQTGQILFYAPKLETGMMPSFSGGQINSVSNIPGFVDAMTARTTATEGAKAGLDIVEVPDGNGGTVRMSRLDALSALKPPVSEPATYTDDRAGRPQAEVDAINKIATGGRQQTVVLPAGGGPAITTFGRTTSEAARAADRERAVAGAKRESEAPDAGQRVGSLTDSIDRMITNANSIINSPALSRSVGIYGALPSIPGGQAADMDATIESFKAQISGQVLQTMRDMSKTGGAVGNVTEKEWPRLEGMLGALHAKMSPEKFREAAGNIIKELQVSRSRIMDAYRQEFGRTPGAVAPRSRADILKQYEVE